MARGDGAAAAEKADEPPLQALVFADTFTQNFRPLTIDRPKVLLPLLNVPLLDYTLEWLSAAGVEKAVVFCCAHAAFVQTYLQRHPRWANSLATGAPQKSSKRPSMEIVLLVSHACKSIGDALRVVYERGTFRHDFVLCFGDTVANFPLRSLVQTHRQRVKKDGSVMTIVGRRAPPGTRRARYGEGELHVALDNTTSQLLALADETSDDGGATLRVGREWFEGRFVVRCRSDVQITDVYIASPEVLSLFQDNFDWENLRGDFIQGMLIEGVELGKNLHVSLLDELPAEDDGAGAGGGGAPSAAAAAGGAAPVPRPRRRYYACRAHNMRAFGAMARDISQRFACEPVAVDRNLFHPLASGSGGDDGPWGVSDASPGTYRRVRGGGGGPRQSFYAEDGVAASELAACDVGNDSVIGAGTSLHRGCVVSGSSVGRGCVIGEGAAVVNSVLLNGCRIGPRCVVRDSFLSVGVTLHPGSGVEGGCVLGRGVVVGEGVCVPPGRRLALNLPPGDDDALDSDDDPMGDMLRGSEQRQHEGAPELRSPPDLDPPPAAHAAAAVAARGEGGGGSGGDVLAEARLPPWDADSVGAGGAGWRWASWESGMSLAMPSRAAYAMPTTAAAADGGGGGPEGARAAAAAAAARGGAAAAAPPALSEGTDAVFQREMTATFLRCVREKFDKSNVIVELNSLKIAEDRTFADCARFIAVALLGLALPAPPGVEAQDYGLYRNDFDVAAAAKDAAALKELVALLRGQLGNWGELLQRFLKSEDDQVEVLLTLEEYASEEGDFQGMMGGVYAPVFAHIVKELFEADVLSGEAILAWAAEKEGADEEDKVFVGKCASLLEWLEEDDEDDDDESSSEEEEEEEEGE